MVIIVVHDGAEAKFEAMHLVANLLADGKKAAMVDSRYYNFVRRNIKSTDKVILIGHNLVAKQELQSITDLEYDIFGMKYGFKDNLCVISAQILKLNMRELGEFDKYYRSRISIPEKMDAGAAPKKHADRIAEIVCPAACKVADITGKTFARPDLLRLQYRLLVMEFQNFGLSKFLDELPKTFYKGGA